MSARQQQLQFVDTNIFLYAYDKSNPEKQEKAKALISELWKSAEGCISIQVLQELYVNLTKKIKHPLNSDLAGQIISDLGQWRCHHPNLFSLENAFRIEKMYQLSFWDALIICSAQQMNCSLLWTEDLNDGQDYNGVQVINLFKKREG